MLSRTGAASIALAAGALAAPAGAQQPDAPPPAQPSAPGSIGTPGLRDFQLNPRQRIVTQPTVERPQPATPTPAPTRQSAQPNQPAPRTAAPDTRPRPSVARDSADPAREPVAAPLPAPPTVDTLPAPTTTVETTTGAPQTAPEPTTPAPAATPTPANEVSGSLDDEAVPMWLILLGGIGLGVIAYMIYNRRKAAQRRAEARPEPALSAAVPVPSAPRAPRPDPVPRPWLEIELTPERTTADPNESIVEFEMCVRNSGGSTARNIRLQAKLICSTPDQDKEIGAFHRKKPGEHRTLDIPDIAAGQELRLKGQVDVKREDLKALRMEQRLLWVPLVAVNAFYDWGTERSGQTSKSFLVGREQADAGEKMAPFRLDLGPRVYRTVGQRPYKIERRV